VHAGEIIRLLVDFWPRWRARCRVNPQTADFITRSLIIGSLMARRWFIDANEHGRARENIVPSLNRDHLDSVREERSSSAFYRPLPPPCSLACGSRPDRKKTGSASLSFQRLSASDSTRRKPDSNAGRYRIFDDCSACPRHRPRSA